ncbi:hypothetical protein K443DRAFT_12075 [Laccaria amethystina LaAM-08-1]|uniref:Uncharacterized protein n=1 Tax=Laccaria amethystina LaAM-08-1 TaxID=1095629 RepID=A0A0C9WS92_9AGAR|nr:hypothetical protein K443DRAFT_12075 [Laccaria amethystina LaAM-08-1]
MVSTLRETDKTMTKAKPKPRPAKKQPKEDVATGSTEATEQNVGGEIEGKSGGDGTIGVGKGRKERKR